MLEFKIRKVGNSLGALIPSEVANRLHVKEGDTLYLTEDVGGYRLAAANPGFQAAMQALDEVRSAYRDALAELAKR